MADRSDLTSFIMACAKKYEEKHPDEKVSMIQNTKIPIDCDYCNNHKELEHIPFSDISTYICNGNLVFDCECERQQVIKINYCPKCGRKLTW